jgi:hypothetical protein
MVEEKMEVIMRRKEEEELLWILDLLKKLLYLKVIMEVDKLYRRIKKVKPLKKK